MAKGAPIRQPLIDLYVKCFDLSEEERDHGLGAVEVNYGEHWFSEFIGEVLNVISSEMTPEEQTAADRRLI